MGPFVASNDALVREALRSLCGFDSVMAVAMGCFQLRRGGRSNAVFEEPAGEERASLFLAGHYAVLVRHSRLDLG